VAPMLLGESSGEGAGVGVGVVSGFSIRPAQEKRVRPEAVVDGKTVWGCQKVVDRLLNDSDSHYLRALLARSCSPPRFEDRGCGCCWFGWLVMLTLNTHRH
jgi:hypothetical protein